MKEVSKGVRRIVLGSWAFRLIFILFSLWTLGGTSSIRIDYLVVLHAYVEVYRVEMKFLQDLHCCEEMCAAVRRLAWQALLLHHKPYNLTRTISRVVYSLRGERLTPGIDLHCPTAPEVTAHNVLPR